MQNFGWLVGWLVGWFVGWLEPKKQEKLKRYLLKILIWYDPLRVGPCES